MPKTSKKLTTRNERFKAQAAAKPKASRLIPKITPGPVAIKQTRRWSKRVSARRAIKRIQKNSTFVVGVRRAPFTRMCREILSTIGVDTRMEEKLPLVLRDVVENMMHDVIVPARRNFEAEKRETLLIRDVQSSARNELDPRHGLVSENFDDYLHMRQVMNLGPLVVPTQQSETTAIFGPSVPREQPTHSSARKVPTKRSRSEETSVTPSIVSPSVEESMESPSKKGRIGEESQIDASSESGERKAEGEEAPAAEIAAETDGEEEEEDEESEESESEEEEEKEETASLTSVISDIIGVI